MLLAKSWEDINGKFHIQHKTKYLGKFRERFTLRVSQGRGRRTGPGLPVQKSCYHCLAVHVQEVGSLLTFHNSPKIFYSVTSIGLLLQPLPADNFVFQVSDNYGSVLF